jgi:hypothetical protein
MGLRIEAWRGVTGPAVVCDHCGEPIRDACEGNCQWRAGGDGTPYFTHKSCCRAFEAARGGHWCAMELQCFPVYLGNGLKVKWRAARRAAALLASL